jgi:hypothetical protein
MPSPKGIKGIKRKGKKKPERPPGNWRTKRTETVKKKRKR